MKNKFHEGICAEGMSKIMQKLKRIAPKSLMVVIILVILASSVYMLFLRNGLFFMFSSGDYEIYENIDHMTARATDIVRGVILDERVEEINTLLPPRGGPNEWYLSRRGDFYSIHTINRIRIVEVFKGDAQVGDIMEIAQLGGRLGLTVQNVSHRLQFAVDDDVILFMRTFHASHGVYGPATLLAGGQGVFRATGESVFSEGIIATYDNNSLMAYVAMESFCPDAHCNNLVLTIGDLILIRYESGLGPRPHSLRPPEGVDRGRLNNSIAIAEYHLPLNYNRPGWDNVQILLDEAIRVRDNPYSRQIHVNHASFDLRHEMFLLGIDTNLPVPTPGPTEAVYAD